MRKSKAWSVSRVLVKMRRSHKDCPTKRKALAIQRLEHAQWQRGIRPICYDDITRIVQRAHSVFRSDLIDIVDYECEWNPPTGGFFKASDLGGRPSGINATVEHDRHIFNISKYGT